MNCRSSVVRATATPKTIWKNSARSAYFEDEARETDRLRHELMRDVRMAGSDAATFNARRKYELGTSRQFAAKRSFKHRGRWDPYFISKSKVRLTVS